MDFEATKTQTMAESIEQAMSALLSAGTVLYDAAIGVSEECWVTINEVSRERGEFFHYTVRVRRRVYGVTIEWMRGRVAGSGENRRMLFNTITRGKTASYPRSRFPSAKEAELKVIMDAEKEFGKIRAASDLVARAGRRLSWAQKALERKGELSEQRTKEVLREASKACAMANSFKDE